MASANSAFEIPDKPALEGLEAKWDAAWEAAGTRLLHRDGDDAEVEVYSGAGDRQSVRVVREAKSWKVELPLR